MDTFRAYYNLVRLAGNIKNNPKRIAIIVYYHLVQQVTRYPSCTFVGRLSP